MSPETFAGYLKEPWYEILLEWSEIQFEDDDLGSMMLGGAGGDSNRDEVEVLVRREEDNSWSIVAFDLSRHNGRWLIDAINITE